MKDLIKIVKSLSGDEIAGGKADEKSPKDFNQDEMLLGIIEEFSEHTDNPDVAAEIAMDHLTDKPNYYSDMEKKFKKSEIDGIISVLSKSDKKADEILSLEYKLHKAQLQKSEHAKSIECELVELEKSWFSEPSKMKDPYKQFEAQAAKIKSNKFGSSSTNNQESRSGVGGAYQKLKPLKLKMSEPNSSDNCPTCQKEDKPGSCECLDKSFIATPKTKTTMALARKGPGKIKDEAGTTYASLRDAADKLKINSGNISRQLRGDIKETGGHRFTPLNTQKDKKK